MNSPAGTTTDEALVWCLEDIYESRDDWESELAAIERGIEGLADHADRLTDDASALRAGLDLYHDTLKRLYAASSYASMRYHEDMRVGETAEMEARANLLATKLSEAASFMEPAILAADRATIERWAAEEPGLADYRHTLDDILRRAEHTLGPKEEAIIAATGLLSDAPETVYAMFANADAPWPTVELADGTEVRLDQSAFGKHRESGNRDDRRLVFERFFEVWNDYARTCGATLFAQVKKDMFYAKVRRYPSSLARSLDANRIPETVYRQLIASAREHLSVLHRYFDIRRRLLGLDDLRYYDIYPPLVEADLTYTIDEAKRLVVESAAPLGTEYVETLAHGLEARWMDVEPRQGKRSGAYMNGHVYDVHPYVLMNFQGTYDSVSTLAHEWGHAMHSHLSNRAQPFADSHYSIFTAEVASTFNEALLMDRMLAEADGAWERLFFLGRELEALRGTFFRQSMFAEFELRIHETVEGGDTLSADRFTKIYGELQRAYHGHDQGVLTVDDAYTAEWAYIPHFYYNFYVYQYATSVAASSLLVERVRQGESGAVDDYLELLASGGSKYPYEQLVEAGVDLATPKPYEALMRRMVGIMDEIEALVAAGVTAD
ncbi:MAG TPA: oligoendopeptidase F [Gemmatimonadota bacterium]|nr:oligoendopeptidase F [Gemmatimonadota bacterium]